PSTRPGRWWAGRSWWWGISRRRPCAASRARACCWRPRAGIASCWYGPTNPSRPGRSCASAVRQWTEHGLSAPAILARGLRRDFGGVAVLAGVDLTVEPGELLVLPGPNGAGQTTLR